MNDAFAVRGGERVGDLPGDRDRASEVEPPFVTQDRVDSWPSMEAIEMNLRPSTSPRSWMRRMFRCEICDPSSSSCLNRCIAEGSAIRPARITFIATPDRVAVVGEKDAAHAAFAEHPLDVVALPEIGAGLHEAGDARGRQPCGDGGGRRRGARAGVGAGLLKVASGSEANCVSSAGDAILAWFARGPPHFTHADEPAR